MNVPVRARISPWLIWACGALFFGYEFCLQSSPSVMVPELMKAFHVNASQLGKLSAFYFYAYAFMQLPVGLWLDRYGPRIIMTVACFVCALGTFIFGRTHTLGYAELARFLMGLGSACAFISALKLASLWFPSNRFALLAGFMVMFGMLGSIGGQVPLAHFVKYYGWRNSMEILSIIGFVLSGIFWLVVRNGPLFLSYQAASSNSFSQQGLQQVLGNRQIWLMALYAALMFSPTPAFGELWGIPFVISTFGVSKGLAAKVVSMLFVGWIVGCPLFGYLSDRTRRRMPYIKLGCFASLIAIIFIVFIGNTNVWLMGIGLFVFGLFSSTFMLMFTLAKEVTDEQYVGTATGFLNALNALIPGLLQVSMGIVLDYFWTGKMQEGVRYYTLANYRYASFSLVFVIAGALAILYLIKSKKYETRH